MVSNYFFFSYFVFSAKIKNIEATEEAKHKLLMEKMRKKDAEVSDFVPTNMAVNFVQHNRCKSLEGCERYSDI